MGRSRFQSAVVITAIVVICSLGGFGSLWAYEEELNQQMHGVEPGPEATRALIQEAFFGFLAGAMVGGGVLGIAGIAFICLRQRSLR